MTASDLRIEPITTKEERKQFAKFPWTIYKDDPNWVAPIFMDRLTLLDPEKHPFHEHADVQYFMAFRGQEPVGTISAHVNHRHNEVFEDKVGFFGFFETINDFAVAQALLEAASEWLRAQVWTPYAGRRALARMRSAASWSRALTALPGC